VLDVNTEYEAGVERDMKLATLYPSAHVLEQAGAAHIGGEIERCEMVPAERCVVSPAISITEPSTVVYVLTQPSASVDVQDVPLQEMVVLAHEPERSRARLQLKKEQ
jgi:hypothetical protein